MGHGLEAEGSKVPPHRLLSFIIHDTRCYLYNNERYAAVTNMSNMRFSRIRRGSGHAPGLASAYSHKQIAAEGSFRSVPGFIIAAGVMTVDVDRTPCPNFKPLTCVAAHRRLTVGLTVGCWGSNDVRNFF